MGDIEHKARQLAAELRYDVGQFPHAGTNQRYARAAELLERLADQRRGAVEAARAAVDYLDELTVYWEIDSLPPEVADRFDAVRDALNAIGGQ
jgi:hypothetical protein